VSVIDLASGVLRLEEGVELRGGLKLSVLLKTPFRRFLLGNLSNPPWQTLTAAGARLEGGVQVNLVLVFHGGRLNQASFFVADCRAQGGQAEFEFHRDWLEQRIGSGSHARPWGMVSAEHDPKGDQANICVTWRGISNLYDGSIPPAP